MDIHIVAFSLFSKKNSSPRTVVAPVKTQEAHDFPHTELPELRTHQKKAEIQEATPHIPEAIEQAAMFYSIDQADAAIAVLEAAIHGNDLGKYVHRAWGMLFELYQIEGRRQQFDQLATAYTAKFETSPPPWLEEASDEPEPAAAAMPRLAGKGKSAVTLSGMLDAQSWETLKQVFTITEKSHSVRLELGKLTDADEHGCGLLNTALKKLRAAGKECVLGGADKLAALLAKKTVAGEREHEPVWLLLLTLYQLLGKQGAFEEVAVNYAVTFEVSPPSFEMPEEEPVAEPEPEAEADTGIKDATCALAGVIVSADTAAFAAIRTEATLTPEVVVDVSRLQRMNFVAATNLMNVAAELMAMQKKVRLIKASHLLTALWEAIGLDRVARIETRKI
jgi:anti-anti-sigma regulatory factor